MPERYSPEQAWQEAEEMKRQIAAGEAADHADAAARIEGREPQAARVSDAEFARTIDTPEKFREMYGGRPLVAQLESVRHDVDGKTIMEHTRQLLLTLKTDGLPDLGADGADIRVADLMRAVGLYHDADKVYRARGSGPKEADEAAIRQALEEAGKAEPGLLPDGRSRALFAELMRTGDYFGYNLGLLAVPEGPALDKRCEELIERVVSRPLERLGAAGLRVDPDTLFSLQFALSRADSLAIEKFKTSGRQLDALRARLLDYVG